MDNKNKNRDGQIVYVDDYGTEYVLDEAGNRMPPLHTSKIVSKPGEFLVFDASRGHCAFCGSLLCRGSCFK